MAGMKQPKLLAVMIAIAAAVVAAGTSGCAIKDHFTGEGEAKKIRALGVPAEATVLRIWDTGVTVNEDPVVGFLLDVKPANQPSFQAETKSLISRLAVPRVQPGARLSVMYDPKDPRRVALDPIP